MLPNRVLLGALVLTVLGGCVLYDDTCTRGDANGGHGGLPGDGWDSGDTGAGSDSSTVANATRYVVVPLSRPKNRAATAGS